MTEYGNVLIALSAMRRSGIMEDLREVLGERSIEFMAVAAAMVLHPSASPGIVETLSGTCICGMLGLDAASMSTERIRKVVNGITPAEMAQYFELRSGRSEGSVFILGRPMQLIRRGRNDPAVDWTGNTAPTDLIVTAVNGSGTPLGFLHIDNPSPNLSNIGAVIESYSRSDRDCIFVPDRAISRFVDLGKAAKDMEFIIPFTSDSDRFAEVESSFEDLRCESNRREISESELYVAEKQAWLRLSDGRWGLTVSEEGCGNGMPLKAFMVYDPGLEAREVQVLLHHLDLMKRRFDGISGDQIGMLDEAAGKLVRFLSVSEDSSRRLRVHVRRSEVSRFAERNATILILSSTASWMKVAEAYVARSRFLESLDVLDGGSPWILKHMEKGVNLRNHFFLRLVVLQTVDVIASLLRESGTRLSVDEALMLGASYKLVSIDGTTVRSRRDRRLSRLLTLIDIKETRDPMAFMDKTGRDECLDVE